MTANIKMLPLYAELQGHPKLEIIKHYARAVAEHNISELVDDRDDLLARLDASIDHGTKLGAAQQRCLDEVLEQKAEIERLRAEREVIVAEAVKYADKSGRLEAKVERLAEALRELLVDMERAQANMRNAAKTVPRWKGCAGAIQPRVDAARAALRDHDQEDEK